MPFLKDIIDAFNVKHETVVSKGTKLQVVESKKVKMFKLDDITHSIINKKSIYTGGYWDYLIPLVFTAKKPRILLIGLGMGTSVYQLRSLFGKKISLEAVEKDKAVVSLAWRHASYLKNERIIIGDGAAYISRKKNRYDLIFLDAYERAARIPNVFLTQKFIESAHKALKRHGIMAINYSMNPRGIIKFRSFKRLLKSVFAVYTVSADSYGGTRLLLCLKGLHKQEVLDALKQMRVNKSNSAVAMRYREMKEL